MTEPATPGDRSTPDGPVPLNEPPVPMTTLRDGTEVAIVPMQATDSARLMRFHGTLSAETTYARFFSFHPELTSAELERFTHVDHCDREAIVALAEDEIVGVTRFDRFDDVSEAEVAFVVADSWQGRGIGALLFECLVRRAVALGVTRLVADTLPYNRRMLAVFRHADLPITERIEEGVVHLTLDLAGALSDPDR